MKKRDFFISGKYYLIHNYGNGGEHIFKNDENYYYFLKRMNDHMSESWTPVSWVLLPDSYKLIVRINNFADEFTPEQINQTVCSKFGNFTNGYAKAINNAFNRRGSVFARNFGRKLIATEHELRETIYSMHFEPVSRLIVQSLPEWKFSSFNKFLFRKDETKFDEMIRPFGSRENFLSAHHINISERSVA